MAINAKNDIGPTLKAYFNDMTNRYDNKQCLALFKKLKEAKGKEAKKIKQALIYLNLGLVISISKKFLNRGADFEDLVQVGVTGLIRAIEKFDLKKRVTFGTYAIYWLKAVIIRYLEQTKLVRAPHWMYNPGQKEKGSEIPVIEQLDEMANIEEQYCDPEQINADYRHDVERLLENLAPRSRTILKMYYGIGRKEMTLEQIGIVFHVTRERIRQINKESIEKIRKIDMIKKK